MIDRFHLQHDMADLLAQVQTNKKSASVDICDCWPQWESSAF